MLNLQQSNKVAKFQPQQKPVWLPSLTAHPNNWYPNLRFQTWQRGKNMGNSWTNTDTVRSCFKDHGAFKEALKLLFHSSGQQALFLHFTLRQVTNLKRKTTGKDEFRYSSECASGHHPLPSPFPGKNKPLFSPSETWVSAKGIQIEALGAHHLPRLQLWEVHVAWISWNQAVMAVPLEHLKFFEEDTFWMPQILVLKNARCIVCLY